MVLAFSSAGLMSSFVWMIFPMAVAAASAKAVYGERTTTASARPKLRECPAVPEEVQIPKGDCSASICKAILLLKEDFPACMRIILFFELFKKISPPFSMITCEQCFNSSRPTNSATAPATIRDVSSVAFATGLSATSADEVSVYLYGDPVLHSSSIFL